MVKTRRFHCPGPRLNPGGEIRSRKPRGMAKNKNKKTQLNCYIYKLSITEIGEWGGSEWAANGGEKKGKAKRRKG